MRHYVSNGFILSVKGYLRTNAYTAGVVSFLLGFWNSCRWRYVWLQRHVDVTGHFALLRRYIIGGLASFTTWW